MSSMQHKLDRVRRPRVQITYDVETNGAMQKTELPFVVGVLADLSAQPTEPLQAAQGSASSSTSTATTSTTSWPRRRRAWPLKVAEQADRRGHQAGRRAEIQAHRRLRAGRDRRAGRPRSRNCWTCDIG